jgi:hypothetical protein
MKQCHINQLRQLKKLNPAAAKRIIQQFEPNHPDKAVKLITDALKRVNDKLAHTQTPKPHRSDTCAHCGKNWRNCGHQQMGEADETPEAKLYQARSLNIGESIINMLLPDQTPVEPLPALTRAEIEQGLAKVLGNQQPQTAKGTIPAAWL